MRRRLAALIAATAVVAALAVLLGYGIRTGQPDAARAAGPVTELRSAPAPPLTGTTLDGRSFDLTRLRGQVVLVNVWASWCDPCRQELPALAAAQRRWSGRGFAVVALGVRDTTESARRLLTDLGVTGLTTVTDPHGTTAVAWGTRGVPETFLVDRQGVVRVWARGAVDTAWLQRRVTPLLAS
ncbi:hypothetical protein GCM10009682_23410 [Luedemannella flava]|uniref:Thioredoxin domain-containing protein n=1 Tax=Luedemannella flava TaxID=349316 RepID=A0ABP4Y1T0_9ACTN